MSELFENLWKYMDKKKMAYDMLKLHVLPAAKLAAADSESKIDDPIVAAIELLADRFLGE